MFICIFFFFKQKTAYEMRISDWSSDACSSDLIGVERERIDRLARVHAVRGVPDRLELAEAADELGAVHRLQKLGPRLAVAMLAGERAAVGGAQPRGLSHEIAQIGEPRCGGEFEIYPSVRSVGRRVGERCWSGG